MEPSRGIVLAGFAGAFLVALALRTAARRWPAALLRASASVAESLLIGAALFFLIARPFLIEAVSIRAEGRSMRPTLHEEDRILANKLVYDFLEPARGDIVIFSAPPQALRETPDRKRYIKRVVGLPGDRLRADADGHLVVNGKLIDEDYVAEPIAFLPFPSPNDGFHGLRVVDGEVVVPEDALFVLGDNRNASYDSSDWGFLPRGLVVGKATMVFWPPARVRRLD